MDLNNLVHEVLNIRPGEENIVSDRVLKLIDLDAAFRSNPNARVLNNDVLISKKTSDEYTNTIYSDYKQELDFIPSCECGAVQGESKLGLTCSLCGTQCSSKFVDNISQSTWVAIPDNMAPVMHPIWYLILSNWTKIGRRHIPIIDIILNPEEEIPEDLAPLIKGRGFKYFYEHADDILNMLLYEYPKTAKKDNVEMFIHLWKNYRDVMFTRHLPILHNSLHPLKSNGSTLYYTDAASKEILAAIIDIGAETFREHATVVSERKANKALFEIYSTIVKYYESLIENKLGGKTGLLRKHNFGSRVHFSFRTVVIPQQMAYPMDEIILPWGVMVQSLKFVILNFLVHRRYMSLESAYHKFMRALTSYDEDVDACMEEFIAEMPGGRVATLVGRNPTLAYGSIMQLFVRHYKKDPHDETMALNACICAPANIGDNRKTVFF